MTRRYGRRRPSGEINATKDTSIGGGTLFGIREMRAEDAADVLEIYQAGLDGGDASFETRAPSWADFDAARLPAHRFVAIDAEGRVGGWVTVTATSKRPVYAGVVEDGVYVAPHAR